MEEKETDIRKKLDQVFKFLQALDQIKNPVIKDLKSQLWHSWLHDMPEHNCVQIGPVWEENLIPNPAEDNESSAKQEHFVLKIRRPEQIPLPVPPSEIIKWLDKGWDKCNQSVSVHPIIENDIDDKEIIFYIEDEANNMQSYSNWLKLRDEWAEQQKIVNHVQGVFEEVYEIYSRIQRESEQVELILGDGLLSWPRGDGITINHPLIMQRIDLTFDPSVPEFIFFESDRGPEFYSALLRNIPNLEPIVISRGIQEIEEKGIHPLAGIITSNFLASLAPQISAKGEYIGDGLPSGESEIPRIGRARVLFLRRRNLGFSLALESILNDLPHKPINEIPDFLSRATGLTNKTTNSMTSEMVTIDPNGEDEEVLFSKEANGEQLQIVKSVQSEQAALVQGPPGTGKTHTIANLIGHFLAQGKSILVTSYSSKALQVLRDQVVPPLQPLCVSVLADENRKVLEGAINDITERLSRSNADVLDDEAKCLEHKRLGLINYLRSLRQDLKTARLSEYIPITITGQDFRPIEAAKWVAAGKGLHDWVPSSVRLNEPCPISNSECRELYKLNAMLKSEEVKHLSQALPPIDLLLEPEEFAKLILNKANLEKEELNNGIELWRSEDSDLNTLIIQTSYEAVKAAIIDYDNMQNWLKIIAREAVEGIEKDIWVSLIQFARNTHSLFTKHRELLLEYKAEIPTDRPLEEVQQILNEMYSYTNSSGTVSKIKIILKPKWKAILSNSTVNGYQPTTPKHVEVLKAYVDVQVEYERLLQRWNRQIAIINGPLIDKDIEDPLKICLQYSQQMENAINWYATVWTPALNSLMNIGFIWDKFLAKNKANSDDLIESV